MSGWSVSITLLRGSGYGSELNPLTFETSSLWGDEWMDLGSSDQKDNLLSPLTVGSPWCVIGCAFWEVGRYIWILAFLLIFLLLWNHLNLPWCGGDFGSHKYTRTYIGSIKHQRSHWIVPKNTSKLGLNTKI